jgi:hypothetical protein
MRSLPFYSTDLKRQKRDVTMAFMAMVLVHRARVCCKCSQAGTDSQGYDVFLHVCVHVYKREQCSGFGLDPPRCGNGHGGTLGSRWQRHGDYTLIGEVVRWTHPLWQWREDGGVGVSMQ